MFRSAAIIFVLATAAGLTAPAPVLRNRPSQAASDEAKVSKAAEAFFEACRQSDRAILKGVIDYPFLLILPCKGGSISEWDEFDARVLALYAKTISGGGFRVEKVVKPVQYAKATGGGEKDPFVETLGAGVLIAYLDSKDDPKKRFALLVRVGAKGTRVVGFGAAPPFEKEK